MFVELLPSTHEATSIVASCWVWLDALHTASVWAFAYIEMVLATFTVSLAHKIVCRLLSSDSLYLFWLPMATQDIICVYQARLLSFLKTICPWCKADKLLIPSHIRVANRRSSSWIKRRQEWSCLVFICRVVHLVREDRIFIRHDRISMVFSFLPFRQLSFILCYSELFNQIHLSALIVDTLLTRGICCCVDRREYAIVWFV